jgi:hypothetical protein
VLGTVIVEGEIGTFEGQWRNRVSSLKVAALKVVKLRGRQPITDKDPLAALITDAYATVAVAYRRASAAYTDDEDLLQLGTAAVHLLTIATSYMAAQSAKVGHM